MNYFIIGDEDTVLGFGMVGVIGVIASNQQEAQDAFGKALEHKDVGIVIITEGVADLIRAQVNKYIFTEQFPLILEIPDRSGRMAGKPSLREMVNSAIGVKL